MEGFSLSIESILAESVRMGASDTHITVGLPPLIRVDGMLMPLGNQPLTAADTEYLCKSMIDKSRQQYLNERGEIDFSYIVENFSRFRCNVFKQRGTYALAARTITNEIPTCEQLGLPNIFKDLVMKPRGLILVTGPTGSGKSTTLAAMIGHVNMSKKCHILTLEEPIEYLHMHGEAMINQREIHEDTLSFANALRAALREDPDIILVGEMRDLDTISTAITAAETGHLVLSTLHTNDAASTVVRLIDMGVAPYMVATSLIGVIAQRLVKVLCPECKVPRMTTEEENDLLGIESSIQIFDAGGCPMCNNTGYRGRTAIHEIIHCTAKVSSIIAAGGGKEEIEEAARANGTKLLRDNAAQLCIQGKTSIDEVVRTTFTV